MRHLGVSDPEPVIAHRATGAAPFLITCDHAGRAVPRALGRLGLPPEAFERHIAWDIGAGALARALGERLGAAVFEQAYSRLVIDCNRTPGRPDSIPERVDATPIPGNAALAADDAAARRAEIHAPYHAAIAEALDRRAAAGRPTIVIFLHSFTPVLAGFARPWTLGVLHAGDSPFSAAVLCALRARHGEAVGDNEPYAMDETDYSAGRHARARGLDYLELEVRQDLIADPAGVEAMAQTLAPVLQEAAGLSSPSGEDESAKRSG